MAKRRDDIVESQPLAREPIDLLPIVFELFVHSLKTQSTPVQSSG